ncbi:hypothetical protein Clacol_010144 [Clathrus columnatus]|uniref:Serine protease K12H4.7 n=1 Tax=Clathrus columnatus TaxID=1419009 RepID=A0AAV5ASX9_9AGAM|nr:hypothetical protein Clacol_010144 [Clathrus columnatus]
MRALRYLLVLPLCSLALSIKRHPNIPPRPAIPQIDIPEDVTRFDKSGAVLPPLNKTYFFDQLIDHNEPSKGTFKQRFWTTWQEYESVVNFSVRHVGGPIILMTPGEVNAEAYIGYLTNATINGLVAQANNGTTIVLEHRFFGLSNPIDNLKDESLTILTIDQAAKDLAYFAKNVKLPQPGGNELTADKAPWVLIGGSYAGALVSWTLVDQPGVFWAGYASSAVVEAMNDYWGYFEPIRQNMPKNCSADIEAVISHIDQVFTSGTLAEIQEIKEMFGMGDVRHLDDAAGALRNILWDWQSLQPYTGPNATFFQSCDALEVKDGVSAPATGWGLTHALPTFGSYFKNVYLPSLTVLVVTTLLSHFIPILPLMTPPDLGRGGDFALSCNEVGFSQDGAPPNWPTLVSRLIQPSYDERQCTLFFPEAFPNPRAPNIAATNAKYQGWNVNLDRLFVANGKQDPWREATLSSDFHTRVSTSSQPIYVGNGFHCSDLIVQSGIDPTIKAVIDAGVATLSNWLTEWPGSKAKTMNSVSPPMEFSPSQIPSDVVTATPQAVPAVATQAMTVPAVSGASTMDLDSDNHAAFDALIRRPVQL